MRVFLGVTGASGAPYAERLLRALAAVDCEIGLTASRSGIEVLATELYGDPSLSREEVLERFVGSAASQVTVYAENDFRSPYASGSARVDAYVICPCSMATVGTLASGAMQNLIHRAASVALKERRKLVLVPRETPLSSIGQTKDAAYFVQYVTNPAAFNNMVMGSYAYLGQENLEALGAFLEASKGGG